MKKTGVLFQISQIILILGLLTSCGVDPRWGPPKSGLRENMAWQYEEVAIAQPVAPISVMRAKPVFPPPLMAISDIPDIPEQHIYTRDRKVQLVGGRAVAPAYAPEVVKRAVAAGNRLQRYPYKFGGGHAQLNDSGYDCSGSVSYVLREAGIMAGQMPSRGFLNYGSPGEGEWITVWAKDGHVYMTIGGLRLDTGGSPKTDGPRWKTPERNRSGFRARHPVGL